MTLRADDRGVTVQVGTLLLFATLVVAMSLYQATVVPNQNAEVEFRHGERVQGQLHDVRNSILRASATGTDQPTSVTLGTRYPERVFFLNPPPASGTLRTVELGNVSIENVAASAPETADYVSGTLTFETRELVYAPNYHRYGNAPDTVYENTVVYNRADEGSATLTEQGLVRGRSITLVALDGELSRSQSGTTSLDPRAISPSTTVTRTVPIRSNGTGNVTVRVPTGLGEGEWKRLLEDQMTPDGYVTNVSVEGGVLELTLRETDASGDPVTYDLRMAKVGVGSGASNAKSRYVTKVSGGGASVVENGRRRLVVEVRDRYNNPVSGATVNFTLAEAKSKTEHELDNGTAGGETVRATTGADGRASVSYRLDSVQGKGDDAEVRVGIDGTPPAEGAFDVQRKETLAFSLTLVGRNGGDGGGDDSPGDGGGGQLKYRGDGTAVDIDDSGKAAGVRFSVAGNAERSITITDIGIDPRENVKRLSDPTADVGEWKSEVYVDADVRNGGVDVGNGVDLPATIDIDRDGWYGHYDGEPVLSGDGTATFSLYQFRTNGGVQAEMSNSAIDVTLKYELEDGTTGSVTFTVSPE
ncbi:Ig-like domain-containing protein [Haladaptatus salinisoli]|uniref:Ig-like domain-containing protein n=1 Tax=Haladaptatus salinisoli TaxID=2884876 RepID=UPI001D0BA466|nr:Ig-like domain-containing protein [Haladaptatus salinisoli]